MSGLVNELLDRHFGHLPELSVSTGNNLIVNGELLDSPPEIISASPNFCKEHQMSKDICKLMKHKKS